jgi:peptide/nickel transport system permease protein
MISTAGSPAPHDSPLGPLEGLFLGRLRFWAAGNGLGENWRIFQKNRIGLIGLGIIGFFLALALIQPILTATIWDRKVYDPVMGFDPSVAASPAPPSARHWLGTDPLGRDVLSQLMYSARSEFALGVIAAVLTALIATSVGAIAAYFGGVVDAVFMRLADLIMMMPFVSVLIVLSAMFRIGMAELAVVIGILSGFGGATIVIKAQALSIKVRPYIDAARVAGGNDLHIILHHIIPNLLPLSFLYMMFTVTEAVFSEAVLSFFGLVTIRMSWGLMVHTAEVNGYLLRLDTWWLVVPAGVCITLLCSSFYLVGRALDEVVNPRLRRR